MWCVAFAPLLPPKVAKKKGRLGRPRGKTGRTGRTGRTGKTRTPVTPVTPVSPVSLVSPLFTGIFFNTHAHKGAPKTLRSLRFFKKTSARLSVFFQKIFCYLYIFNTRFSDHSCHPSHFFHCTHFTYLPHTYYYIRGRLLLLKKRNVKPMLNVIFAFWSKLPIIRELQKIAQKVPKFFAKKICRFQKSRYLCIRFQKITKAHEFWDRLRLKNFWKFFFEKVWKFKKSPYLCNPLWKISDAKSQGQYREQYVLWSNEAAKYVQKYSRFLNSMPLRNKPRY